MQTLQTKDREALIRCSSATISAPPAPRLVPKIDTENVTLIRNLETAIQVANGPSQKKFERLTDECVKALSTPTAIWLQSISIGTYVLANTLVACRVIQFDPYPFMFLNTLFSLLSAYTTVFVLNSNRRQDAVAKATEKAELDIYKKVLADLAVLKGKTNEK